MIVVDQRITQRIVFIAVFQYGMFQFSAFFQTQPFGQGSGGDVADDDLQRNDGHFFYHSFPVGDFLYQMGGNPVFLQHFHQMVRHPIVDDTFAFDSTFFQAVKGGGVVFIVHNIQVGVVGFEYFFGLSFIQLFQLFHK